MRKTTSEQKRRLYESIMRDASKVVKRHLNENDWNDFEKPNRIYDDEGNDITKETREKQRIARIRHREELRNSSDMQKNEYLPSLLEEVENLSMSTRNLKSLCAFMDHGHWQFGKVFDSFCETYKDSIVKELNTYHIIYNDMIDLYNNLKKITKSNKLDMSFFGVSDDFCIKIKELIEQIDKISLSITKSDILSSRYFMTSDLMLGSEDGKRKGLMKIVQELFSTKKITLKKLREFEKNSKNAYNAMNDF